MQRFVLLATLMLTSSVASAAPLKITPTMRVAPGRFIVKVTDPKAVNASPETQRAFVKQLAAKTKIDFVLVRPLALGWLYLDVADMTDEDRTIAAAESLKGVAGVVVAEPDRIARAMRLPNDELLDFMWHLDEMRLPQAWDITTGSSSTRVGVVDSGIIRHEDLDDALIGAIDFISEPSVSADGDGRDNDATDVVPEETGFHGSHVAGTIMARGDNGVGIAGANWTGKLVVARALGRGGSGATSDINEGAFWLAGGEVPGITTLTASQRAKVINLSLGSDGGGGCAAFSAEIFAAIDAAGGISVIAAGNDGGPVNSPANCGGVIAVGATGPGRQLTGYSSFGPEIDIVAPGGDVSSDLINGVLSTVGSSESSFDDGVPYAFFEGTSMATPNVAGVISLMLGLDPSLTRSTVEAILQETGTSCSGCDGKPFIDAAAAVAFVEGGGVVEAPTCSNTCRFADDNECDDGRAGAISAACEAGSDCNDCDGGGGGGGGGGSCTAANNGCQFADDDECDDSSGTGACADGSDGRDCGLCRDGDGGGGGGDDEDDGDDGDDEDDGDGRGGRVGSNSSGLCGQGAPATMGVLALALLARRRRRP